jgi:hypothetical protein
MACKMNEILVVNMHEFPWATTPHCRCICNTSANHWFPYSSLELLKQVAKEVQKVKAQ